MIITEIIFSFFDDIQGPTPIVSIPNSIDSELIHEVLTSSVIYYNFDTPVSSRPINITLLNWERTGLIYIRRTPNPSVRRGYIYFMFLILAKEHDDANIIVVQSCLAIIILSKGYRIHHQLYYHALGMIILNIALIYSFFVDSWIKSFVQTIIYFSSFIIFLIHYEHFLHERTWQPMVLFAIFIFFLKIILALIFLFWSTSVNPDDLMTGADQNAAELYHIVWEHHMRNIGMKEFFILSQLISTRVMVFLIAFRMLYIIQKVHSENKINGTLWDRNSLLLIFIFTLCSLFFHPFLFSLGQIFAMVGLFLLLINNLKHHDYAFKIPMSIVKIIIYNQYGILVYLRRFQSSQKDYLENETLLSGYLVAISNLINETLGDKVILHRLEAKPFDIEFHTFAEQKIHFAIISYGVIPYINRAIQKFEKRLSQEIIDKINAPIIHKTDLQTEIDEKIKEVFPFLVFKE